MPTLVPCTPSQGLGLHLLYAQETQGAASFVTTVPMLAYCYECASITAQSSNLPKSNIAVLYHVRAEKATTARHLSLHCCYSSGARGARRKCCTSAVPRAPPKYHAKCLCSPASASTMYTILGHMAPLLEPHSTAPAIQVRAVTRPVQCHVCALLPSLVPSLSLSLSLSKTATLTDTHAHKSLKGGTQ